MKYLNILTILVLLLIAVSVKAEFRTINFIPKCKVYALKDTLLFAAGQSGIFVSSDNGVHWESRNLGYFDQDFSTICVDAGNIYAGSLQGNIYKSSDNGDTWISLDVNPQLDKVTAMCASKNRIIAASSNRIIESKDGGDTWELFDTIKSNKAINSITFFKDKIFISSNYVGTYYYTSDKLSNPVTFEYSHNIVYSYYQKNDRLYICSDAGAVYSTDSTISNWKNEISIKKNPIYSVFISGNDIFAFTSRNGVLVSKNTGTGWDTLNIFNSQNTWGKFDNRGDSIYIFSNFGIKLLGFNRQPIQVSKLNEFDTLTQKSTYLLKDTLYLLNDVYGLCKTHVRKFEPVVLNNSAFISPLVKITGCGNYLFAWDKNERLFRSLDFGNTWSQSKASSYALEEIQEYAGKLFALTSYFFKVSLDSGASFTFASPQIGFEYFYHLFCHKEELFLTSTSRTYMSVDSGVNWCNASDDPKDLLNKVFRMINYNDTIIGFVNDSLSSYVYFTPDNHEWRQSQFKNPIKLSKIIYNDNNYIMGVNSNGAIVLASYLSKSWYETKYPYTNDYFGLHPAYLDSNNLYFFSWRSGVTKLIIPKSLKAPINLGPKNGALQTNSQCIVRWSPSSGAISYTMQLALD